MLNVFVTPAATGGVSPTYKPMAPAIILAKLCAGEFKAFKDHPNLWDLYAGADGSDIYLETETGIYYISQEDGRLTFESHDLDGFGGTIYRLENFEWDQE